MNYKLLLMRNFSRNLLLRCQRRDPRFAIAVTSKSKNTGNHRKEIKSHESLPQIKSD